jgi:hypothetical protein
VLISRARHNAAAISIASLNCCSFPICATTGVRSAQEQD